MIIGTYLEVEGCFGAALVGLLNCDKDFKIVNGFVMALETGFTERTDGIKQVLPSDVDT